ncbi:AbrB/MazE/SpoVT family DNA-binding domain-containing protein [Candidatus Woesearchaeota archaeon]|nr:AbrB/MazE/SpoVT family DNA-binding domain-containing protein [Candidatus Woesearchaeota archaeon]
MEKVLLEKQGRLLIPKKIREKLGLRTGEELTIETKEDKMIISAFKTMPEFVSSLKGCVKESRIKPLELKKIWEF